MPVPCTEAEQLIRVQRDARNALIGAQEVPEEKLEQTERSLRELKQSG